MHISDWSSDVCSSDLIGQRFGSIRGPVNVVGGFAWETIADGSVPTWDRLYLLNVRTTLTATRAALPQFANGGATVNIGAGAAARAPAGTGASAACNGGLERCTPVPAAKRPHGP